ncbi:MAG: LytTR family DNA-binding domain-containing protein [Lachnospiraceae bacterium]|nr:LytTR family DNA-binding domain-containing protein [Lachnospiraceae bacterium]
MELLQIAICEDDNEDKEKLIGTLKSILDTHKIAHCITCFDNGEALLASDTEFHLIFMDIAMSGKNGIETGRQIYNRNRSPKIIYQTNFRSYCEEAVNTVHAFAFLTKPLTEEALREQIKEFLRQTPPEEHLLEFHKISYMEKGVLQQKTTLQIPIKSIYYFEALKSKKKIKIVTNNHIYEYTDTIKNLENRLHSLGFETSCRGILVNMENIARIKNYKIFFKNGECVALSQKRAVEFKKNLNAYIHKGE